MFLFKIVPFFGFDYTDPNRRLWLKTAVSELSFTCGRRTVYCIKSIFMALRFLRSDVYLPLVGVIVCTLMEYPLMLTYWVSEVKLSNVL
jgi:hypothetical protein